MVGGSTQSKRLYRSPCQTLLATNKTPTAKRWRVLERFLRTQNYSLQISQQLTPSTRLSDRISGFQVSESFPNTDSFLQAVKVVYSETGIEQINADNWDILQGCGTSCIQGATAEGRSRRERIPRLLDASIQKGSPWPTWASYFPKKGTTVRRIYLMMHIRYFKHREDEKENGHWLE